jgi:hypothetical protein
MFETEESSSSQILHINNSLKHDLKRNAENGNFAAKKFESSTLNSILKNSSSKLNGSPHGHTKNISFGETE